MAYPMYPQSYQQFQAYQPYQQPVMQATPPVSGSFQNGNNQPMQQAAPQIQSGGFMSVRSIDEAYNWPLAPGVSMTFKVENAPVVCTKTRGFSPLEEPVFKIFDMHERVQQPIEAPTVPPQAPPVPAPAYALQSDVDALRSEVMGELEGFRARLDGMAEKPAARRTKKEDDGNDGSVR